MRAFARDWNTKDPASGFVATSFASRSSSRTSTGSRPTGSGGKGIDELWVPADELAEFNHHIVGAIEVTAEYRQCLERKP